MAMGQRPVRRWRKSTKRRRRREIFGGVGAFDTGGLRVEEKSGGEKRREVGFFTA
jgi:hypothetical protein